MATKIIKEPKKGQPQDAPKIPVREPLLSHAMAAALMSDPKMGNSTQDWRSIAIIMETHPNAEAVNYRPMNWSACNCHLALHLAG